MTVTNPYYEFTPEFTPGTKARSDAVNLQLQAIQNAFDFLPGSADAITTGTSTFGPESGAGNAYVVAMPDTRLSEQDGDEVIFFATHTNTGAATLDVDGLGAKAIVRADGLASTASDLQSGLLYVLRYDATNTRYQLVGPSTSYLTDATAQAVAAAASATAADGSAIAAAASAVEAMQWAVNPEDDDVDSAPGQFSAFHWAQKALGAASTNRIVTDISTATPPTTEAVSGELQIYDADETDQLARFGFVASNNLVIGNVMHGGNVQIIAESSAGAPVTLFDGDPDLAQVTFNASLFAVEQAAANADVPNYGQFWVRNDTPNTPMFTDDTGVDYELNATIPDGSESGAMLYWNGSAWISTTNMTYAQAGGAGTATVDLGVDGDSYIHFQVIDGNVIQMNKEVRLVNSNVLGFWPTGTTARPYIYTSATGPTVRLSAESPSTLQNTGFIVEYPIGLQTTNGNKPTTAQGDGGKFWMSSFNYGAYKTVLMWSNEDNIANPVDNVSEISFQWTTSTASPGSNEFINGNAATIDATTLLYPGDTDLSANDSGWFWDMLNVGDTIELYQSNSKTTWVHYQVDSITDSTGYWTIGVTPLSRGASTAFTNLTEIRVRFQKNVSVAAGLIAADINTATPPTTEAVTALINYYDLDETDLLATIGFNGSNVLQFKNKMHSGGFAFTGEQITTGTEATILTGDPDAGVELYHGGFRRAHAAGGGDFWVLKDNSTADALNMPIVTFGYQNDTILGEIGYDNFIYVIRSRVNGQPVLVQTWTSGGAQTTSASFSANDQLLYYNGTQVFRTFTSGIYITGGIIKMPQITSAGSAATNEGMYWVKDNANTTLAMFTAEVGSGNYTLQNTISEFSYAFNTTTTAADPGAGNFRLNNTVYGSVTEMYVSSYDFAVPYLGSASSSNTNDWVWGLAAIGDLVTIRSAYDPRRYLQALITSITDNGVWHTVGLDIQTSGSLFMLTQDNCRFHIQHLSRAPGSATPSTLYSGSTARVVANASGVAVLKSDSSPGIASSQTANLILEQADGVDIGGFGFFASEDLQIRQFNHGGNVIIAAEDSAGTERTILLADPDNATVLTGDTNLELQVAAGESALLANANGSVILYHDNTSVIATQALGATGVTSAGNIKDHAGNLRDIGFNVLRTFNFNATDTLEAQHCGHATGKDNTTSYTLTGPANTDVDFPVGGVAHVWNLGSSVDYTISDTASCTMYFCDGSAAPVDIVGSGTLAPGGMVTLWRYSTTAIYITGSGFTA